MGSFVALKKEKLSSATKKSNSHILKRSNVKEKLLQADFTSSEDENNESSIDTLLKDDASILLGSDRKS